MTTGLWTAVHRLTVLISIFAAVSWAMAVSPGATAILNAQDRVQFFLGAAVLGAVLPRIGAVLIAPRLNALHIHSAAIAFCSIGFIIAAMSGVTGRTSSLSLQVYDGPSRMVFRNLYILCEVCFLITVVPTDARGMIAKWAQIAKVLGVVAVMMVALSYADRLPAWLRLRTELHDAAPLGPDTGGHP